MTTLRLLNEAPLAATVANLAQRKHTLTAHVREMCDRIDAVDMHVKAFLPEEERRSRLLQEADALSRCFPPEATPPLYGSLVGVKDIFHVDGFVTHAGSQVPPELFAGAEAACVKMLREAGALIAGKTVTTEFAYFEPGPTRNPHDLNHTPGGSSSGSAAAVAAGLCNLAIGTQTIGSVIRPAAYCGVMGYKPTYDRIPTQGVVYFSRTVDHVGLFTQDAAGMLLAASVLCHNWRAASATGGKRPVLAVPVGAYLQQVEQDALAHFEKSVEQLEKVRYPVQRISAFDDIDALNELHRRLAFAEFAQEHREWYAQYSNLYRPRTAEIIEIGKTVPNDELQAGRAHCQTLRDQLHALMDQHAVDLWICPAAPGPAPVGLETTGSPLLNLPWTHSGLPAVSIPAGSTENGLPLGLQLVGRFGEDETLLRWAGEMSECFLFES